MQPSYTTSVVVVVSGTEVVVVEAGTSVVDVVSLKTSTVCSCCELQDTKIDKIITSKKRFVFFIN